MFNVLNATIYSLLFMIVFVLVLQSEFQRWPPLLWWLYIPLSEVSTVTKQQKQTPRQISCPELYTVPGLE
jgi:hypothetical protein